MGSAEPTIRIIDETIREGMQYRGLVFSLDQRIRILDFQEAIGVDICQAGYPPAHPREAEMVRAVADRARKKGYRIRVAALGRAFLPDARILLDAGVHDLHFHLHLKNSATDQDLEKTVAGLGTVLDLVRAKRPDAAVSIAMLDMGRTRPDLLATCIRALCLNLKIDILSLPDTSGIMAPNQVGARIRDAVSQAGDTAIAVHCHNDMGMASANSIMGITAGARILEASVLGIGERNGIADLLTTAGLLKGQGLPMGLDTENRNAIRAYYEFVNRIVRDQTGDALIRYDTPVFGDAVNTHVAGTHAGGEFGTTSTENFFLNPLCGRRLVQKFLDLNDIPFKAGDLDRITADIKDRSFTLGRRLKTAEVRDIVCDIGHSEA